MKKWVALFVLSLFIFTFLNGCASNEAQGNQGDYEETKKMLVDLLKSDDGKKAIKEVLTDEEIKKQIIMDQDSVQLAIEETLTSEKGAQFWKERMQDPKFAEAFAKSMQKEHEELMKKLMKDPEYQKMMMEILKDPEMEKQSLELLKTQSAREQMSKVITETFESPLYKAKIADILKSVVDEELKAGGGAKKEEGKGSEEGK
jgi:spore germination protein D